MAPQRPTSMQFDPPDNARHAAASRFRVANAVEQLAVIGTGSVVGVIIWFLKRLIGAIEEAKLCELIRIRLLSTWVAAPEGAASPFLFAWAFHAGAGLGLALAAYCSVVLLPTAQGSGLPPLIAYLNGIKLMRYSSLTTIAAKIVGSACSVTSGLSCGPEGPMIHLGAAVGKQWLRLLFRFSKLPLPFDGLRAFGDARSDSVQRDFAAIGSGAGVAAAFYAPLAGTMFVVEEAASHFSLPLMLNAFTAGVTAVFVMHQLEKTDQSGSYFSMGTIYNAGYGEMCHPSILELASVTVLAALGGALGALFNYCALGLARMRNRWRGPDPRSRRARFVMPLVEVVLVTLLSSSARLLITEFDAAAGSSLQRVQRMASSPDQIVSAAMQKIAEFRRLKYPMSIIRGACTYVAATSGNARWLDVRSVIGTMI